MRFSRSKAQNNLYSCRRWGRPNQKEYLQTKCQALDLRLHLLRIHNRHNHNSYICICSTLSTTHCLLKPINTCAILKSQSNDIIFQNEQLSPKCFISNSSRVKGGKMTIGDTLYIVIPAYNEEANLEELLAGWYPMLDCAGPQSRILIINDGSKDGTAEILVRLQEDYPQLTYLNEENKGHGPSLIQAYTYAVEAGADYIFQTDSDNQTSPLDFPDLWMRRKAYPVCAGFRRNREDGKARVFVSKVLTAVLAIFYRVRVKDANVPFRLYRSSVLAVLLPKVSADFKLINALLMAETRKLGLLHYYHDITFSARQKGSNSINPKKIFLIGRQAIASLFRESRKFFANKNMLRNKLAQEGCQFE